MTIARRTFLFSAGLFAASPVLAKLFTPATGEVRALPLSAPARLAPQLSATSADGADVVFKIDGWSSREAIAADRAPIADSSTQGVTSDEAWLVVNKSWRAAWR